MRLFPQLFILIAATALVAVVSMSGVMALNLERGFSDYLAVRDTEELEIFVRVAGKKIATNRSAGAVSVLRTALPKMQGGFWYGQPG